MKVILVGQGRTPWDEESRVQGTIDVPLSPRGRKEVTTLARKLRAFHPKRIITGTGQTLRETAAVLAQKLGCRVTNHKQLNGLDHGLWQGMRLDELEERYPHVYRRWVKSPQSVSPPRGESISELLVRVGEVIEETQRRRQDGAVVMVLPELVRLAAQALLTGVTLETIWFKRPSRRQWTEVEV